MKLTKILLILTVSFVTSLIFRLISDSFTSGWTGGCISMAIICLIIENKND